MLKIKTNIFTICILALFTTTASATLLPMVKVGPCETDDLPNNASGGTYNNKGKCSNITCLPGYKQDNQRTACIVDTGASCTPASQTPNATSYEYADNNGTAECVVTKCEANYKVADKTCVAYNDGDECTPSTPLDKRATEYFWDSTTSSCLIANCTDDYVTDIAHKKCVTGKKQLKEQNQLDKDYIKDFEQLLDAYNKVAKKHIEDCLKDGGTIKEWKCEKQQ